LKPADTLPTSWWTSRTGFAVVGAILVASGCSAIVYRWKGYGGLTPISARSSPDAAFESSER
jgi:hypothetical protein